MENIKNIGKYLDALPEWKKCQRLTSGLLALYPNSGHKCAAHVAQRRREARDTSQPAAVRLLVLRTEYKYYLRQGDNTI
jgi:hypothetical protein